MGFFDKMFGQRPSKMQLIRALLKTRLAADPMARGAGVTPSAVDAESDAAISGTPEATIVAIVETYTSLKRQGISDQDALHRIEEHRSIIGSADLPIPLTLLTYVRHRILIEYTASAPVSDASIERSVQEARRFFSTP